jgi:predicted O-methyltransferase YrrM
MVSPNILKLKQLGQIMLLPIFRYHLLSAARSAVSMDDHLDVAFNLRLRGLHIKPLQLRAEFERLMEMVAKERPKRVLEIGTAKGGTLYLLARAASTDAVLLSIDLPGGPFGSGYPWWRSSLLRSFGFGGQKIHLLRRDSHHPDTLKKVQEILQKKPLDLLYVDGDHRYKGVKTDFELYSPLVRPAGLVVFHDIAPGPAKSVGDVPDFWHVVRDNFSEYEEIILGEPGQGYGIGIGRFQ